MTDAETVMTDVEMSVADFRKGGLSNIVSGLKDIGDILEGIQKDMSDCANIKADWGKMTGMIASFKSPWSFAYHVGKDLVVNGKDIYYEIDTAIADYDQGQWEPFGYQIGTAAAKLLVGEEEKKAVKVSAIEVEQIVEGILRGALDAEGFTDITQCMNDAETVISDVELAVGDFKKGGVSNIVDGLKQVGDILEGVQKDMSDCSSIKADWGKMTTMIASFKSPWSFAYHTGKDLVVNGADIYQEIDAAVSDYDQGQWEQFGYQIGTASAKLLIGTEKQIAPFTLYW